MEPDSQVNSPAHSRFWELFHAHWRCGTGLSPEINARDSGWRDRTFCDAVEKAKMPVPDKNTLQAWRDGRQWPQADSRDKIFAAFFPAGSPEPERQEMMKAWEFGQGAPYANRKAPSQLQPSPAAKPDSQSWTIYGHEQVDGLVELTL